MSAVDENNNNFLSEVKQSLHVSNVSKIIARDNEFNQLKEKLLKFIKKKLIWFFLYLWSTGYW
jgi:hypothetical protein